MKEVTDNIVLLDKGTSKSFAARELKGSDAVFEFSLSMTAETDSGENTRISPVDGDNAANFAQNFKYWNQTTFTMSANNLENSYFHAIVAMGKSAVPFIHSELKKGPSQLVYALDRIFPGVVKYNGFVSLAKASETWLSILEKIDKN